MLNILGIYRPPSTDMELFCNFIWDEILHCFTSNELVLYEDNLDISLVNYNASYDCDAMQSN